MMNCILDIFKCESGVGFKSRIPLLVKLCSCSDFTLFWKWQRFIKKITESKEKSNENAVDLQIDDIEKIQL